jgi:protocatechuate 3,4-dioxygenase, beta subunit
MFTRLSLLTTLTAAVGLLGISCGGDSNQTPPATTGEAFVDGTPASSPTQSRPPTQDSGTATSGGSPAATRPAVTAAAATATASGPLKLTPSQTEGPFYPPNKPTDRDNDLTVVRGQPGPATGTPLLLSGTLVRRDGTPVAGATVEIWHVDQNGIYLHPQQPEADRDKNFQSYGESVTDATGAWSFRTTSPPAYEGRPRHIHVKVRVDGKEVLTTQVYFEGDPLLANDGVSRNSDVSLMTVKPEAATDGGKQVEKATWRIVIA